MAGLRGYMVVVIVLTAVMAGTAGPPRAAFENWAPAWWTATLRGDVGDGSGGLQGHLRDGRLKVELTGPELEILSGSTPLQAGASVSIPPDPRPQNDIRCFNIG